MVLIAQLISLSFLLLLLPTSCVVVVVVVTKHCYCCCCHCCSCCCQLHWCASGWLLFLLLTSCIVVGVIVAKLSLINDNRPFVVVTKRLLLLSPNWASCCYFQNVVDVAKLLWSPSCSDRQAVTVVVFIVVIIVAKLLLLSPNFC